MDMEIIGEGNIGDKARQLLEKSPKLQEIGFHVPRRVVLAEDFFDGYFRRNKLGENLRSVEVQEGLEEKVRKGAIQRKELWKLQEIASSFEGSPPHNS